MIKTISFYKDTEIAHNHSLNTMPVDEYFPFHTHDICEIIYLKSGNISAIIGEKTYKVPEDSIVIFRANLPHRVRIDGSEQYERHNVLFDENVLANGILFKLPNELNVVSCSENNRFKELFDKIDYYYEKFEGDNLKVLVTNIVEEILFNIYVNPEEDFNANQMLVHPVIKSAVEYINSHYMEQISIDEISRYACVTKSHLHHLFAEHLEISPKKFINMKRLSRAQKLISMGEKPTVIYTKCGFTDYGTFFRNYTNHFGYTPSQKDEIVSERKIES